MGRIVRQGNENDTVGIYNYVTQNTFDAYLMNIIVTKQKFISQLMSGQTPARTCEDVDEMVLNYSEIQALASGDPRIKEKIELDNDVARLKMLETAHYNEQYRLDDTITNAQKLLKTLEQNIEAAHNDLAYSDKNLLPPDTFSIEINGKVYTERKEAGAALREAAVDFMANENGSYHQTIGTFCGFELAVEKIRNGFTVSAGIAIRHEMTYTADMDITGDIGNITRLENLFNSGIQKKIDYLEDRKKRTDGDLQAALSSKGKPFEHAEELAQKSARLEQLNLELEVGKADEVIMNDDAEQPAPDRDAPEHDAPDNDRGKPAAPKHSRR